MNNTRDDYFVNNLNPHWVSYVFTPHIIFFMNPNTADTILRCIFRYTFDYYSRCLREPTTMIRGCLTLFYISSIFLYILPNYENVVAPSASTINILWPVAAAMPARTAPPLPLFLGYSTTNKLEFNYLPLFNAAYVVLSLDPSLTTSI